MGDGESGEMVEVVGRGRGGGDCRGDEGGGGC